MPTKPNRICRCGRVVPGGQRCPDCSAQWRRASDARRGSSSQRGYGSKWQRARAEFLKHHHWCVTCGKPANVVDHIKPHRGDQALFWNKSNWQPMCDHCHSSTKQREENRGGSDISKRRPQTGRQIFC